MADGARQDPSLMDADFSPQLTPAEQQQHQQQHQQQQQGLEVHTAMSSHCAGGGSSSKLMLDLQQQYPSLSAVLSAVRTGGLSAVLAGPYGTAVTAVAAKPAGQLLLMDFARLAGDEPLLAAALQQQQAAAEQPVVGDGCAVQGCPPPPPPPQQQQAPVVLLSSPAPHQATGLNRPAGIPPPQPSAAAVAGVQDALHHLHCSIARSQQAAAVQLLNSLSLALDIQHENLTAAGAAAASQQQKLQQQQALLTDLQAKLQVAEQQAAAEHKQRLAHQAAAKAAEKSLKVANDKLELALLCQICYDRPRDTVLMPCMHFLYCAKCIQQGAVAAAAAAAAGSKKAEGSPLRCPVCRVPCSGQVVVHLAAT
jgi:hypothetical protein